jgi:hypothetical protein
MGKRKNSTYSVKKSIYFVKRKNHLLFYKVSYVRVLERHSKVLSKNQLTLSKDQQHTTLFCQKINLLCLESTQLLRGGGGLAKRATVPQFPGGRVLEVLLQGLQSKCTNATDSNGKHVGQ